MNDKDKIRFRWYHDDLARFWIVDEVLGLNLGFCRSESVAERLCSKLNLLESDIVLQSLAEYSDYACRHRPPPFL